MPAWLAWVIIAPVLGGVEMLNPAALGEASGEAAGAPQMPPVVIPARSAADGSAGLRSIRGEQAPGTQHLERDDARRTGK